METPQACCLHPALVFTYSTTSLNQPYSDSYVKPHFPDLTTFTEYIGTRLSFKLRSGFVVTHYQCDDRLTDEVATSSQYFVVAVSSVGKLWASRCDSD